MFEVERLEEIKSQSLRNCDRLKKMIGEVFEREAGSVFKNPMTISGLESDRFLMGLIDAKIGAIGMSYADGTLKASDIDGLVRALLYMSASLRADNGEDELPVEVKKPDKKDKQPRRTKKAEKKPESKKEEPPKDIHTEPENVLDASIGDGEIPELTPEEELEVIEDDATVVEESEPEPEAEIEDEPEPEPEPEPKPEPVKKAPVKNRGAKKTRKNKPVELPFPDDEPVEEGESLGEATSNDVAEEVSEPSQPVNFVPNLKEMQEREIAEKKANNGSREPPLNQVPSLKAMQEREIAEMEASMENGMEPPLQKVPSLKEMQEREIAEKMRELASPPRTDLHEDVPSESEKIARAEREVSDRARRPSPRNRVVEIVTEPEPEPKPEPEPEPVAVREPEPEPERDMTPKEQALDTSVKKRSTPRIRRKSDVQESEVEVIEEVFDEEPEKEGRSMSFD